MRYALAKELPAMCLPHQDGGIPLSIFPNGTQRVNLPACFPHCSFNAERQAEKLRIPILKSLV